MLAEGFLAHLVGDFCFQSHWMATEKTKRWFPALVHAVTYTLPFLIITRFVWALLIIGGTHAVLDRYRLPKYLIWAKNQIAPKTHRFPLREAIGNAGFPAAVPAGLATAMLIIVDNTMHIAINTGALCWLGR
jgi:hypothetical protein